jgi:hypothetical protein
MLAFEDSPGGASTEPKRVGLPVERKESGNDEDILKFTDLRRLSILYF